MKIKIAKKISSDTDVGKAVSFRKVVRRIVLIIERRAFDKALSSRMLAIDGQIVVQIRHDFLNNGENK